MVKALDFPFPIQGSRFKTTGWLQVDSVIHPSEASQIAAKNTWGLSDKN